MESEEDGMFVVIIGESSDTNTELKICLKSEVKDEIKAEEVSYLIEKAERYGELVDWNLFQGTKKENEVKDSNDCSNEEFCPTEFTEDDEEDEDDLETQVADKVRRKMLEPSECKSYVRQLIKENPEYREQKDMLVKHLANVMKALKAPPPPENFCQMHDKESQFQCLKCHSVFRTLPACQRHYQDKHGPRYLTCFACGVDFRSKTNLYKHEKRCIAPDIGYVLRARAISVGMKGRRRPFLSLEQRTKDKTPQRLLCDECPASFLTKTGLTAHQHLHRGERPYRCQNCGAAYTSKCALTRHRIVHGVTRFICDLCGRAYKTKPALTSHMDTHLSEKKFACPYKDCTRRFATNQGLKIHIDGCHRHLPPPCACQLCPRRFKRMSVLKVHMKKAHGFTLMTRRMFFKTLPKLTDMQVKQGKIFYDADLSVRRTDHLLQKDNSDEDKSQNSYCILREDTGEFSQPSVEGLEQGEQHQNEVESQNNEQNQNKEQILNRKKKKGKEKKVTTSDTQNEKELDVVMYLENILKKKKCQQFPEGSKVVVIPNGDVQTPDRTASGTEYESSVGGMNTEIIDTGKSMPEI